MATPRPNHHFLVVTIAGKGQINPASRLARRLAGISGSRVTIATPLHSHRRMFPSSAGNQDPITEDDQGLISYAPYSDGFDDGFDPFTDDGDHFMSQLKLIGSQTLTRLASNLAARGHPVTCIIYTLLLPWVADVAANLSLPSFLFWTQPAAVLIIYYHYYHGSASLISAHKDDPSFRLKLPGLPPFHFRDLPSMLTGPSPYSASFEEIFQILDKARSVTTKPRVLINTFNSLEADAISAFDELDLHCIGPLVEVAGDLHEQDRCEYMKWLDSKEERSVVYLSFGSLSQLTEKQMEEFSKGLEECGRPYLWVVRRGQREVGLEGRGKGMIVEWCAQVKVLSHRSVGCFVTHCGWNSTVESITCGVPMVMLPQWTDQSTNARLVEGMWGVGVRGRLNEEGVLEGEELKRCLDLVMAGEGVEIRRAVEMWKDKAREAVGEDGPSIRSLKAFMDQI